MDKKIFGNDIGMKFIRIETGVQRELNIPSMLPCPILISEFQWRYPNGPDATGKIP
jgi:hypothetical protein